MKYLFAFLLSALSLSVHAQHPKKQGYFIKGHIAGVSDGTKVYLHDIVAAKKLDSTTTKKGNFVFKGRVPHPVSCWILCKEEYAILIVENTNIRFEAPYKKDMRLYARVTGGKEQALHNALTKQQLPYDKIYLSAYDSIVNNLDTGKAHRKALINRLNLYQDSAHQIYVDFGKKYPNSYLGIDILYRNRQTIGKDVLKPLYAQLSDELKQSVRGKALRTFLFEDLVSIGEKMIDFEAMQPDGSLLKLSSLKGQYIFLSFWDKACGPCRMENRLLSKNYDRIKDSVSIVSFSLDADKTRWLTASKEDKIIWTNLSDLKGEESNIKALYDVQAIPASFLINKEGIVIERYTGVGPDLIEKLLKRIAQDRSLLK